MASIAVVGAGAWGTALALHAVRRDHAVTLWAHERRVAEALQRDHENRTYLPRIALPPSLRASNDPAEVVAGAELVLLVPPAQHLRAVAETVRAHLRRDAIVVVASKGMEERTLQLPSQVMAEVLADVDPDRVAFLSGPSFAREVAHGLPTDVAVGSVKRTAARIAQKLLHSPLFRVYTSDDPIGVQVGGAVKNVIAVAAGACDGMRFGLNARAALVTRGLAEITRLGLALGADARTFLGLAGAGDLFLTCTGALSRNRTLGLKVAEGVDAQTWVASQSSVAEGFHTAVAAKALARELGVDMPIVDAVHAVLHEKLPLLEVVKGLLTREFKDEQLGFEIVRRTP